MKKLIGTILAAGVIAVPVASATKPVKTNPSVAAKKAKACKPAKKAGVAYIIRGIVATDATATSVMVDVTSVNQHAKKALQGPTATGAGAYTAMIDVPIAPCTYITRSGKGTSKRTYRALKAGDRVVISWKAKRGTAYANLGAAIRVADRGPTPTA